MLISGIRQKLSHEFNSRRSASVTRYLIHYLQMFAFLGVIFPVLIVIDCRFLDQHADNEIVKDKYYKLRDNLNHIEYFIFTDNYHFLSDLVFYEHLNKGDGIKIFRTCIFRTVTDVTYRTGQADYKYKPTNIYNSWLIVVVGLTFICSLITIIITSMWIRKRDFSKNDPVITFGIINAIMCLITIFAALFPMLY